MWKCKGVKLSVHQGLDFDLTLCIEHNFRVNILFKCSSDTMNSTDRIILQTLSVLKSIYVTWYIILLKAFSLLQVLYYTLHVIDYHQVTSDVCGYSIQAMN